MRKALEPYLGKEITIISTVKEIENSNEKINLKMTERCYLVEL